MRKKKTQVLHHYEHSYYKPELDVDTFIYTGE